MQDTDSSLLARYVRQGEEDAFAELLHRHLPLVYSAALRQVEDQESAQEVTQTVFLTLAQKAAWLQEHPTLTGWLYASTSRAAAQHRRSEHRRRVRETAFQLMRSETGDEAEPDWSALRPVLDDAMNELPPADREVVLWRFFDGRPFREIGDLLGLTENAARMRVERALDRLRTVLDHRGISSSAASLGALLSHRAVASVPPDIAGPMTKSILAQRVPTPLALAPAKLRQGTWSLPVASVLVICLVTLGWWVRRDWDSQAPTNSTLSSLASSTGGLTSNSNAMASVDEGNETAIPTSENPGFTPDSLLTLHFVTRDAGKPVPSVLVNYQGWTQFSWSGVIQRSLVANREGTARIQVVTDQLRMQLTSRAEGFADTRLTWHPPNGERIPTNYVLALDRAVVLGGRVVDFDGQPVPGAEVVFSHREMGAERQGIESHEFGGISAKTDAEGRWRLARIAADMLDRTEVEVSHPEYLTSPSISLSEPETQLALRNQDYVFRLARGTVLSGIVRDSSSRPIDGAIVRLNQVARRKIQTSPTGEFSLSGCPMGEHWLLVEANGYGPATVPVTITPGVDPVEVILEPAQVLRIHVVNQMGRPVTNGWFTLSMNQAIGTSRAALPLPTTPTEFVGQTDFEGKGIWSNAPAGTHAFLIGALGHRTLEKVPLTADGHEQRIVLQPVVNLSIQGKVTDAATGKPLPVFRLAFGWPDWDPVNNRTNARFGNMSETWVRFEGGQYHYQFRNPPLEGMQDPQVMIKCEAAGFGSFISPAIRLNAGLVTLDMALSKTKELQVTVLDPAGQVAVGAEVGMVRRGDRLQLKGTAINRDRGEDPELLRQADARGMLTLATDSSIGSILAVHSSGFARTTFEELEADPHLRLQPWGRIEGQFSQDDPEANFTWLRAAPEGPGDIDMDLGVAQVKAGQDRRFSYAHVPPGQWIVCQVRPVVQATGETASVPGQSKSVTLAAGETVRIDLGGGCRVTGKIALPDSVVAQENMRWMGRLTSGYPEPPSEIRGNQEGLQRWWQQPEIQALIQTAWSRTVMVAADGRFTLDALEPGEYKLGLSMYALPPAASGGGVQAVPRPAWYVTHSFVVNEGSEGTVIDLGLLPAQSLSGTPKSGP